jgi:hypothetical protein
MEPITTLAAGAIVKLAVDEFVKSGAGEGGKKAIGGATALAKNLWGVIKKKFEGDARAEKALAAIEQDGSEPALAKLETYLDDAMAEDQPFATEIRQMAQQIINIQNQNTVGDRTYNNYGRDQINIEKIEGNPKIGGL